MPVILPTQEAEIRKITVRSQPRQIVCETLSRKTLHKERAGRVVQGIVPEFKLQSCKKKKRKKLICLHKKTRMLYKNVHSSCIHSLKLWTIKFPSTRELLNNGRIIQCTYYIALKMFELLIHIRIDIKTSYNRRYK
jgi:hypothetical protein